MINQKRLVETFFDLVQTYSPFGKEDQFADVLVKHLTKIGINLVKKDSYGNVYAKINGRGEPVFFAFHMDTVEPSKDIKPLIKNNYIISDGKTILGADNKAPIACVLEVISLLHEGIKNYRPLELVFTKSEEAGNYGAINFNYRFLKSKTGFCFDSPTPVGTIVTASPFYERFDIQIIGRSAHASKPDEAINALSILNKVLNFQKLGRLDDETILNIGVIHAGSVRNTIPGEITLNGEIRSFSKKKLIENKTKFIKNLKSTVKKLAAKTKVKFVRENPGYKHSSVSINQLIDTLDLKPVTTWAVSDANIFNDNKGIVCFNLGDGCEFTHTNQERIKTSEMKNLIKLMLKLISI